MATVASDLSSAKPENIGSVCPTSTSFRAGVRHTVLMRTRVRARKELASASKGFHEARAPHHALPRLATWTFLLVSVLPLSPPALPPIRVYSRINVCPHVLCAPLYFV